MTENFIEGQSWEFLDHFFDGVYIVDNHRKILFWNKSAEKITGYSKEEALGKCCADNLLRHVTSLGQPLCESGCPLQGPERRLASCGGCISASQVRPPCSRSGEGQPSVRRGWEDPRSRGIFTDNSRHEAVFRQLRTWSATCSRTP